MKTEPKFIEIFKPRTLGSWLADHCYIWQMDFLDTEKFAKFAYKKALNLSPNQLWILWKIGLIHADFIRSKRKLRWKGLLEIEKNEKGRRLYSDERIFVEQKRRSDFNKAEFDYPHPGLKLYFHPFRIFVLYRLFTTLEIKTHPLIVLEGEQNRTIYLETALHRFRNRSSYIKFLRAVQEWNNIAALAVATEPCVYMRLFQNLKFPHHIDVEQGEKTIERHYNEILKYYKKIGMKQLKEFCRELCFTAETLDQNKDLHTILRLIKPKLRLMLNGRLGGCLYLLTMAEVIRRAGEDIFDKKFPEEDELGFGYTPVVLKQKVYGSPRLLDGDRIVAKNFLRWFGLDYSTRIRWYVEGFTEQGALESALGMFSPIEIINLKGEVIQKKGKGVNFRDSLRNDLNERVYSFITLDKDNEDNIRAIRQAVKADEICGRIFVSDPDFEFANFTVLELEEILWEIASNNGATVSKRSHLRNAIIDVKSGKELLEKASEALPELINVKKGINWGERLMKFACESPNCFNKKTKRTDLRPMIEATAEADFALKDDYVRFRSEYRIDHLTFDLVKRKTQ